MKRSVKSGRTCYKCDDEGHISKICSQNNKGSGKEDKKEARTCFKYRKPGHIAKDCHNGNGNATSKKKTETNFAMMATVQRGLFVKFTDKSQSLSILESGGTRHMSNQRNNFSEINSGDAVL